MSSPIKEKPSAFASLQERFKGVNLRQNGLFVALLGPRGVLCVHHT